MQNAEQHCRQLGTMWTVTTLFTAVSINLKQVDIFLTCCGANIVPECQ